MRKTLIAFATVSGLACLAVGASAAPRIVPDASASVQSVDWYCGPRCEQRRYWQHRRWEQQRWQDSQRRYDQYGYHRGYGYNPNYGYGYYNRW
jgi:hypothetical protein